jgi:hypothetical protein
MKTVIRLSGAALIFGSAFFAGPVNAMPLRFPLPLPVAVHARFDPAWQRGEFRPVALYRPAYDRCRPHHHHHHPL